MNIEKQKAESYYINHPKYSYAIFMISEKGDLSVNSDYGISSFAWRSTGEEVSLLGFKKFLIDLNEGYFNGKMQYNLNYMGAKKSNINSFTSHIWPLFQILQEKLRAEVLS